VRQNALSHDRVVFHGDARLTCDHLSQKLLVTRLLVCIAIFALVFVLRHERVFAICRFLGNLGLLLGLGGVECLVCSWQHSELDNVDDVSDFDQLELVDLC